MPAKNWALVSCSYSPYSVYGAVSNTCDAAEFFRCNSHQQFCFIETTCSNYYMIIWHKTGLKCGYTAQSAAE